MDKSYIETVQLLLDVAPYVFRSGGFAMKGGTAINLFLRDMPRLSVDIDLVFLDISLGRDDALTAISQQLGEVAQKLEALTDKVVMTGAKGMDSKLMIYRDGVVVKVEVNTVFRGTVLPPEPLPLCQAAEDMFKRSLNVNTAIPDELYASKLVAAMDRQHPRDLFDVLALRNGEGISDTMRGLFVSYVAGHNRPINEVMTPNPRDISQDYENQFVGMTAEDVSLEELLDVREWLFDYLPKSLTDNERGFLLSLKDGDPDWTLMPFDTLEHLPAIQWKLKNIQNLKADNPDKHAEQLALLTDKLASLSSGPGL